MTLGVVAIVPPEPTSHAVEPSASARKFEVAVSVRAKCSSMLSPVNRLATTPAGVFPFRPTGRSDACYRPQEAQDGWTKS